MFTDRKWWAPELERMKGGAERHRNSLCKGGSSIFGGLIYLFIYLAMHKSVTLFPLTSSTVNTQRCLSIKDSRGAECRSTLLSLSPPPPPMRRSASILLWFEVILHFWCMGTLLSLLVFFGRGWRRKRREANRCFVQNPGNKRSQAMPILFSSPE